MPHDVPVTKKLHDSLTSKMCAPQLPQLSSHTSSIVPGSVHKSSPFLAHGTQLCGIVVHPCPRERPAMTSGTTMNYKSNKNSKRHCCFTHLTLATSIITCGGVSTALLSWPRCHMNRVSHGPARTTVHSDSLAMPKRIQQ